MSEIVTRVVVVNEDEQNRDPISGAPGAHPLGTGAGAATAGVAGAAVGMALGGPVGSMIGAAIGAIAGGLTGKSVAEVANPTQEETYWRESYVHEPYYLEGKSYEYYAPGFRAGWEGRVRYDGRTFEDAEVDLAAAYNAGRSELDPSWPEVRSAAQAAWNRVDKHWTTSAIN